MEKVVKIADSKEGGFDADYWAKKSPKERVLALEKMRNQYVTKNGIRQRLQSVCRIVELK